MNIVRATSKLVPRRAYKHTIYDAEDILPQQRFSTHTPQDDDEDSQPSSLPTHLSQQRLLRQQQQLDTALCVSDNTLLSTYSTTFSTTLSIPSTTYISSSMDEYITGDSSRGNPTTTHWTSAMGDYSTTDDTSQRRPRTTDSQRPQRNQDPKQDPGMQNNDPLPVDDSSSLVRGRQNE